MTRECMRDEPSEYRVPQAIPIMVTLMPSRTPQRMKPAMYEWLVEIANPILDAVTTMEAAKNILRGMTTDFFLKMISNIATKRTAEICEAKKPYSIPTLDSDELLGRNIMGLR